MITYNRTSEILQASGLTLDRTYYLLCGSFGDRYFIASMLHHLLEADPAAVILVNERDKEIARIFLGTTFPGCLFVAPSVHGVLVQACRQDPSAYMPGNRQGLDMAREIPKGCIRSLHTVDYPYFVSLNASRLVRYLDLLRLIMALPASAEPRMPPFLDDRDREAAMEVLTTAGLTSKKKAIINLVAFSHKTIPSEIYARLEEELLSRGYAFAYNVTQGNNPQIQEFIQERAGRRSMMIPGHLMKSVFDEVDLAIGVISGAMSIVDSFCRCHGFTIHTPSLFFPKLDRYPGNPMNYENFRPLPVVPDARQLAWHLMMTEEEQARIPDLFSRFLDELPS